MKRFLFVFLALFLALSSASGPAAVVINSYAFAAASGFTPASVTGLRAWWKADSLALSDGDPISTWTDNSGNGFSATQTGSARPLYKTGIYNGLPTVRFNGSSQSLVQAVSGFTSWRLMMVICPSATSGGTAFRGLFASTNGGGFMFLSNNNTGPMGTYPTGSSGVTLASGTLYLVEMTSDGHFYVNGTSSGSWSSSVSQVVSHIGGLGGQEFAGDICEIVLYDSTIASDVASVRTYLRGASRWNF